MSAETLRRAAALMRERAEHASPSPWQADPDNRVWDCDDDLVVASNVDIPDADIDHIASWHPGVALAVADWLEKEARFEDGAERAGWEPRETTDPALAVARAYLGESA